jgi:hypothetical protein
MTGNELAIRGRRDMRRYDRSNSHPGCGRLPERLPESVRARWPALAIVMPVNAFQLAAIQRIGRDLDVSA